MQKAEVFGGGTEKSAKILTLSLFAFLPIPYPFQHLLRRLCIMTMYISLNLKDFAKAVADYLEKLVHSSDI